MSTTTTRGTCVVVAVVMGGSLAMAQSKQKQEADLTGRWTITLAAGAHGPQTMALLLEQKDRDVTGTVETPHGSIPVRGAFRNGELELATEQTDDGQPQITLGAVLREDGTLAGYLSSSRGDMQWTAARNRTHR